VSRLASGLVQRGWGVRLYCIKSLAIDPTPLLDHGVLIREAHARPRDLSLWLTMLDWLRRDRVDLLHAHSCSGLVAGFPAAKLLALPIVHVRHGWPPGRRALQTVLADWLGPWVDQVVINSESGRGKLRSMHVRRKALHIANGIDDPSSDPSAARHTLETLCGRALPHPVVLSIANLREEKGIRELVQAFGKLRERHQTASLVIVGRRLDAAYARQVDADIARLGLSDCIHLVGSVPNAQRLLPAADVFCLSSTRESMPNVVLEAMAQRVPIVATTVGDVGRLGWASKAGHWVLRHRETGLLAKPGDSRALAEALDDVMSDPAAAKIRANNARGRFETHYQTGRMVDQYAALYKNMLHGRAKHVPGPRRPMIAHLGPPPSEQGGMVTSIRLLSEASASSAVRTILLSNAASKSSTPGWALLNHTAALWRLATTLLTRPVVLLHIHTCSGFTFYRNMVDSCIARLLGIGVIWHIRGGKFAAFCNETGGWRRWVVRTALHSGERVIALSPDFAEQIRAVAPAAKVVALPNAFDPSIDLPPRERDGERVCRFLYLATLRRGKGIFELLEATQALMDRETPFELVLLGAIDDPERGLIEQRLAELCVTNQVRWLGPADAGMKAKWLAWADVFVHPSHSEGLPNAVLEAAASGLPVIATDVGAVRHVLEPDPGSEPLSPLIPARDVAALVAAMQRVVDEPARRTAAGAALANHVRSNYTIESIAARVVALYQAVLGQTLSSPPVRPASRCTRPSRHPQRMPVAQAHPPAARSRSVAVCESW
jgi:glycosyltransferase involved in cell wall biosynthesis